MNSQIEKKMQELSITINFNLIDALKRMDEAHSKLLLVFDGEIFQGLLSIGDIQRAIISNHSLEQPISSFLRSDIKVGSKSDSYEDLKKMMMEYRMEYIPVIDENNKLINVIFWDQIFESKHELRKRNINIPVVIMAGGEGQRLRPLTSVLPKPLIPIKDKTILEDIFEKFSEYSCNNFYVSINYKADFIENYISHLNLNYNINFFREKFPLGTAGSLSLLRSHINSSFFVSNCDIIIEEDYADIYEFHVKNKNELTIVAAIKNYPIAYGTIETGKNGKLVSLKEKPNLTFKINTGFYILEPHLLNEIPESEFFHITDLIEKIKERNGNIGVFPISEGSWQDIGNWEDYLSIISI